MQAQSFKVKLVENARMQPRVMLPRPPGSHLLRVWLLDNSLEEAATLVHRPMQRAEPVTEDQKQSNIV